MKTWIIKDWAGNVIFGGKRFSTFENAWEYIYENQPDESWYTEYYVEQYTYESETV